MTKYYKGRVDCIDKLKTHDTGYYESHNNDPDNNTVTELSKYEKLLHSSLKEFYIKNPDRPGKKLKFLELGCEAGCKTYSFLTKFIHKYLDVYYGVDLPGIIKLSHIKNNKNVFLTDTVFNIKEKTIDIFYANAVINYLKNPYTDLTHILNMSPEYIHIHRTHCTTGDEFATLQLTLNDTTEEVINQVGMWFLNIKKLVDLFELNNYELVYLEKERDRTLWDIPKNNEYWKQYSRNNFIFRKIK